MDRHFLYCLRPTFLLYIFIVLSNWYFRLMVGGFFVLILVFFFFDTSSASMGCCCFWWPGTNRCRLWWRLTGKRSSPYRKIEQHSHSRPPPSTYIQITLWYLFSLDLTIGLLLQFVVLLLSASLLKLKKKLSFFKVNLFLQGRFKVGLSKV